MVFRIGKMLTCFTGPGVPTGPGVATGAIAAIPVPAVPVVPGGATAAEAPACGAEFGNTGSARRTSRVGSNVAAGAAGGSSG